MIKLVLVGLVPEAEEEVYREVLVVVLVEEGEEVVKRNLKLKLNSTLKWILT